MTSDPKAEAALDRINDDPTWAQRAYGANSNEGGRPPLPPRPIAQLLAKLEAAIRREERAITSHELQEATAHTESVRLELRSALTSRVCRECGAELGNQHSKSCRLWFVGRVKEHHIGPLDDAGSSS